MSTLRVDNITDLGDDAVVTAGLVDSGAITSVPGSALPAGSILQVVSTTKTNTFTFSGTTYVDITGLTAAITPSSTSSKIYVVASVSIGGTSGAGVRLRLARDAAAIAVGDSAGSRVPAGTDVYSAEATGNSFYYGQPSLSLSFLDSPSTTSSVTYSVQGSTNTGSGTVNRAGNDPDSANYARTVSTITLMEVAG